MSLLGACSAPSGGGARIDGSPAQDASAPSRDARILEDAALPDDPSRVRAVWLRGRALEGLSNDGSIRSLHTFSEPGGTEFENRSMYGSAALAIGWMTFFAHGSWSRWEAAVVNDRGHVVWHRAGDGNIRVDPFLGDDGSVALGLEHLDAREETVVIDRDGTARTFAGFLPAGPRFATGFVPVWRSQELAWLDTDSGAVRDEERPARYRAALWNEASLVFLADGAEGTAVVRSDGVEEAAVETIYPELYISTPEDEGMERWTTAPWLIVGGADEDDDGGFRDADILRIEFGGPTVTAIGRPSAGWRLETRDAFGPRVDRQGRVYDVYRNEYQSGLVVTSDAGLTWQPFGGAYRAATFIDVYGRGDTFVVHANDGGAFISIAPWSAPPEGAPLLDATAIQLLRAETDSARVFEPTETLWLMPSPSGVEVAMFQRAFGEEMWNVTLIDLATGEETYLGTASADSVNLIALF